MPEPASADDHVAANRASWDERATLHAARDGTGYRVRALVEDRTALSGVVRFDQPRLGDVTGLRTVHLQCHIGTDTLSLARLGAHVTGLDFSARSVDEACRLAAEAGADVDFVVADVHAAADVLPRAAFDLVYTGVGALNWLPSADRWARAVAALLAPGGSVFLREAHPVLWSIDEREEDDLRLRFPYFEQETPLAWDDDQSYVPTSRPLVATRTYEWNHSLGEVVTALLDQGLRLELLVEHDTVPWEALPGRMRVDDRGEWSLVERPGVVPLSYTIRARRPTGR